MRLLTRGSLDGLACATLLSRRHEISDVLLVHPQQISDGAIAVGPEDILVGVPYQPGCALWFDHHPHTATVAAPGSTFEGAFGPAPSVAHLVYDYLGGEGALPEHQELVAETDRLSSADLTPDDVTDPEGYVQLGFTLDSRSGLGSLKGYFFTLLGLLQAGTPIEEILAHPQVAGRTAALREESTRFRQALEEHSVVDVNVVITDFRVLESVPMGNRFLVYAVFPQVNVSVRLQWEAKREGFHMSLGHSIFRRTCRTDLGELAARHGGGGHRGAASIPLSEDADYQLAMVVAELKARG
jgi:hypothetical protein